MEVGDDSGSDISDSDDEDLNRYEDASGHCASGGTDSLSRAMCSESVPFRSALPFQIRMAI